MNRVIDILPLGYGADVLLIRLRELADVVDEHVIVEATQTFTGRERAMLWPKLVEHPEFAPFADKVRWHGFEFASRAPWDRDDEIRDVMLGAACRAAGLGDLILFGDADEIPHPDAVRTARALDLRPAEPPVMVRLPVRTHQWRLDLRCVRPASGRRHRWEFRQPVLVRASQGGHVLSGSKLRAVSGGLPEVGPEGWHLTMQGGAGDVHSKLGAFAHTELQHLTVDDLRRMIREEVEILGRCALERVPFVDLPACVQQDAGRYLRRGMLAEVTYTERREVRL